MTATNPTRVARYLWFLVTGLTLGAVTCAADVTPSHLAQAKAALAQVNRTAHETRSTPTRAKTHPRAVVPAARQLPRRVAKLGAGVAASAAVVKATKTDVAPHLPAVSADALKLRSNVAYVIDAQTREVLVSKNDADVLPIASLTKLMTALVVHDQGLDMNEVIRITEEDVDHLKGSRSRLRVGSKLTRGELMHLALMSSENRAAHALGRTFPGGLSAFVANMNAKAALLGMTSTRYVEPTGLSSENQSNARDLALLVGVAATRPLLRELSTDSGGSVRARNRELAYRNTNALVRSDQWDIALQKTGYIREAGRCLVMQANVADRPLIMVFLDSQGKNTRLGDANRVRKWVERQSHISGRREGVLADQG